MTHFFDILFTRYPVKTRRFLELIPGLVSWTLILSPIWGTLFIPSIMAYFILLFDVYWLYKSFSLVITAYIASGKIKESERTNWLEKAQTLKDSPKVHHVLIFPNYKEHIDKFKLSIESVAKQTLNPKQIIIVLAMEEREVGAKEKAEHIIKTFEGTFFDIIATYHPDVPGEVKGKSSNEAYGAKIAYEKFSKNSHIDMAYTTISSVDADSIFDPQYFACLTFKFLSDPMRYNKFWQSANVNYNNFWSVPAPIRITSFFGSLHRTALLVQGDRLITNSTYSLSFQMLHTIGGWDTDVIPEDYRIFFKAFYKLKGNLWVEPIFLKTLMDAPLSSTYLKSLQNKYNQELRWVWGASDDPVFIKWWLTVPGVPFFRKTMMLYNVLLDHFLWPVNWFIITVAANIMPFVNPVFSRTTLGYNLPQLAGAILTFCLFATLGMIIIDYKNRPKTARYSKTRQFLFPLEFVLLPLVGFFLSALPALISHTQLMLGKRLEYKVTEKL